MKVKEKLSIKSQLKIFPILLMLSILIVYVISYIKSPTEKINEEHDEIVRRMIESSNIENLNRKHVERLSYLKTIKKPTKDEQYDRCILDMLLNSNSNILETQVCKEAWKKFLLTINTTKYNEVDFEKLELYYILNWKMYLRSVVDVTDNIKLYYSKLYNNIHDSDKNKIESLAYLKLLHHYFLILNSTSLNISLKELTLNTEKYLEDFKNDGKLASEESLNIIQKYIDDISITNTKGDRNEIRSKLCNEIFKQLYLLNVFEQQQNIEKEVNQYYFNICTKKGIN